MVIVKYFRAKSKTPRNAIESVFAARCTNPDHLSAGFSRHRRLRAEEKKERRRDHANPAGAEGSGAGRRRGNLAACLSSFAAIGKRTDVAADPRSTQRAASRKSRRNHRKIAGLRRRFRRSAPGAN